MNDEKFRKKCREFSYQQMDDFFKDYKDRGAFISKEGIAIALLYIAANMPNLNDEKKKQEMEREKCSACSRGKIVLRSFEPEETDEVCTDLIFDPKNRTIAINNDIAGFIGSMDITYCPMCGRKLWLAWMKSVI